MLHLHPKIEQNCSTLNYLDKNEERKGHEFLTLFNATKYIVPE